MDPTSDPSGATYFSVVIDGTPLGVFTKIEGLQATRNVDWVEEGGNQGYKYALPGRITYGNVKVTRPICEESEAIPALFLALGSGLLTRRGTAVITALTAQGMPVAAWTLSDVIPVSWSGPQFSSDSNTVATETLEFAHHGFLPGV